jgi:FlaA1/EpsC-like NDP-sugar epimerase
MWYRNRYLFILDTAICLLIFPLVLFLRLDRPDVLPQAWNDFLPLIIPIVFLKLLVFTLFGFYRRAWYYLSLSDLFPLFYAVIIASFTVALFTLLINNTVPTYASNWFPRSYFILDGLLSLIFIGGSRVMVRVVFERTQVQPYTANPLVGGRKRVIIVGAGDAGMSVAREILRKRHNYELIGFVDYDERKKGQRIQGRPVLGVHSYLPEAIRRYRVDEVIIAIPNAPGTVLRRVLEMCKAEGIPTKTVPGVNELIEGRVSLKEVRDVEITDLLRRLPVSQDTTAIANFLSQATVLVTGAGGSIGSELCRKIAAFGPARMVLLGRGENSIFHIVHELKRLFPQIPLVPVIGDIRDALKIDWVIGQYRPEVIFHAAAHKHVPLMEQNAEEVVNVNILGTKNLAEAAVRHGVKRFVAISTDKAVNPVNVMGASKRLAELIIQDLARASGQTSFVAVRFGNVLGSRGSVVPLLKEQIAMGGPVTVTHPDITRYFMTIPEAASLVIQAGAMGDGGEIFVLDMGEPVKIVDLAKDLIRLSGFQVEEDIAIEYTGLRPGEKMYEELLTQKETLGHTRHQKIFVAPPGEPLSHARLESYLQELEELARHFDRAALRKRLLEIANLSEGPAKAAAPLQVEQKTES